LADPFFGNLVTNPANEGSYNKNHPTKDKAGHFWNDMFPYWKWGNSPDDPVSGPKRLIGPIESIF
jgi:hypothetical protein